MSLIFKDDAKSSGIVAYLDKGQLNSYVQNEAIAYAVEEIGKAVVAKYQDEVLKAIKPEEIVKMVKNQVAKSLVSKLIFSIRQ